MRTLFLIAILAPSLSHPQDLTDLLDGEKRCGEYQSLTEHQATALQRVSDCLDQGGPAESVECAAKVLAELEE